jgi:hypothetical protein
MTACPWNWFTEAAATATELALDSYYITTAGTLVGLTPPGDTVNTDESLAGTTLKVHGPFAAYDPTLKVLTTATGQRIQLLRPEATRTLKERTTAWLKTLA